MDSHPIFNRYPELREFIRIIKQEIQQEMLQAKRPSNEIIITDDRVMRILKISERKLDAMKADRVIAFSQEKPRAKCHWLLSDVLAWLKKNRIESLDDDLKIN